MSHSSSDKDLRYQAEHNARAWRREDAAELLAARLALRALAEEFDGFTFVNLEKDGPNSARYFEDYLERWGVLAKGELT